MSDLTPKQARALWEAGGFLVFGDLPEGSEYGIDGTFHVTRRFAGTKFVPPGIHLVTWTATATRGPTSTNAEAGPSGPPIGGPGALSVRHGLLRTWAPRQRVVLQYDPATEAIKSPASSITDVISDDHLRSLDPQLAAYPFSGLERWHALTSHVTQHTLDAVLPGGGAVDGMTSQEGETDEAGDLDEALSAKFGRTADLANAPAVLRFVQFDLKRSWREGAVGEEVTRWSRDKSWLLLDVIGRLGGDPTALLAQLQLAFVLLLYVSSYASLAVYKRLLALLAQSATVLVSIPDVSPDGQSLPSLRSVRTTYIDLVKSLSAHLSALPPTAFEGELPEMDVFYLDQIQALRANLSRSLVVSKEPWLSKDKKALMDAWTELQRTAKSCFSWEIWGIGECALREMEEEEDEDEEGEYAPQIIEM